MEDVRPLAGSASSLRDRCHDLYSNFYTWSLDQYGWLANRDTIEEPTLRESVKLKRVWLVNVMAVPFYIATLICMTAKVSDQILVVVGTPLMLLSAVNLTVPSDALTVFYGSFWSGFVISLLGNVVELAIAGVGLRQCLFNLVVGNMIGSGMSNLMLVSGLSIMAGKNHGQMPIQNRFAFESMYNMLILEAVMLTLPVLFGYYRVDDHTLLLSSRLLAFANFLLFVYYTLYTYGNRQKMNDDNGAFGGIHIGAKGFGCWLFKGNADADAECRSLQRTLPENQALQELQPVGQLSQRSAGEIRSARTSSEHFSIPVEEAPTSKARPEVSLFVCAVLIAFGIISVATTSTAYVDAVVRMVGKFAIPMSVIYYVIMPAIGNLPEHFIALFYGWKGNLDALISNSINSNVQVVMGMLNALVLLAWVTGQPMTVASDMGTVIFSWFSVIVFGKINYTGYAGPLEGILLTMGYVSWVFATWVDPMTRVLSCGGA